MRFSLKKRLQKSKGFTLLEVIIVIVVLGIVASITGPMIYTAAEASKTQGDLSTVLGQARTSMIRMSRDLRNIRSNSATDLAIGASSLSMVEVDTSSVAYTLSGSDLLRNGQILAQGISNLAFSYYDSSGAVTAVSTSVRYIGFSFTATQNDVSDTYHGLVYLRNS
jgi:prepilin-type N-terminal cleavage/methylation domain-containing protein